jgi:hypothetical protein
LANYEYSKLEESNVDNASVDTLISLEEQLETALSVTRARKTELMMGEVKSLQKTENLLREENQTLASQVGKKTFLVIEGDRGMSWENGSGNKVRETLPLLK